MYGHQHDRSQRAEKQCANHQAEGGGHQFRRGVELAAGVSEGGSGHHADGQQADAADGLAVALTHALRNQGLAARLNPDGLQVKRGRFQ